MIKQVLILLVVFGLMTVPVSGQDLPEREVKDSINYFDEVQDESYRVDERVIPVHTVDSLKKQDAYWYADYVPARTKPDSGAYSSALNKNWLRSLLWVLVLTGFVSVVIWYLFSGKPTLFRRAPKVLNEQADKQQVTDIFSLDYEEELNTARNNGNFRLAVRLLYWQALKSLHENGLIRYAADRTNYSYVENLQGSGYFKGFLRLTQQFEYTWYGKFPLSAPQFDAIQKDFDSFKTALYS